MRLNNALHISVFQMPKRVCDSTWVTHIPFSFWLIKVLKPKTLVELGVFKGGSYFSFCESVLYNNIKCKAFGIDTWQGDVHGGVYGNEIFEEITLYNAQNYQQFSTLIRGTFSENCNRFKDNSIDLLHIDGCHTYEEVKADFTKWLPKLKQGGIVLFHDTQVKENNFGVYKFWGEIKNKYYHFEFLHGYGLGVLGIGQKFPLAIKRLFSTCGNSEEEKNIRDVYQHLGSSVYYYFEYTRIKSDFDFLYKRVKEQSLQI